MNINGHLVNSKFNKLKKDVTNNLEPLATRKSSELILKKIFSS